MSRLAQRKKQRPKSPWKKRIIFLILALLFLGVACFFLSPRVWDGKSRLGIAIKKANGDVGIVTVDPFVGAITTINIPGSTAVSAARNLGTWKLSTIWQLGKNEGVDEGGFLAATITKSFRFPIDAWGEGESINKLSKTNLKLHDKVALTLFSLGVKSASKVDIDLHDSDYIVPAKLPDGSRGFKIAQTIPVNIASIFTDSDIAGRGVNVVIVDRMQDNFISSRVGEIIEVLGAKIASIEKETPDTSDCIVVGKDEIRARIARLFGCKEEVKDSGIEVILGKNFKKRF